MMEKLKPGSLMERLQPAASDANQPLPGKQSAQLRNLAVDLRAQILPNTASKHNRSANLVLFTGPGGPGKTTAAQVLARDLDLDLFRIDTTKLASKPIGETEKNLSVIFANAAQSNAILFFDEADALFGKRTGVNDSHDRYASLQSNDLLQQTKTYPGIVILACNQFVAFDPAQSVVDFSGTH